VARYRHLNGVTVSVPDDREMGPEWEPVKASTTQKRSTRKASTKSDDK